MYALGGVLLAGEAAVHVQQYLSLYHEVRWIGPLFLVNVGAYSRFGRGLSSSLAGRERRDWKRR
jgi:hypothetical protein